MARPTVAGHVQMPIALGANQKLLRVEDAANGLAARATCASCGTPVVARQGEILRWHFAHYTDGVATGTCSLESYLHAMGKLLLRKSIEDAIRNSQLLPLTWTQDCFHGTHSVNHMLTKSASAVRSEHVMRGPKGDCRPDLVVMAGQNPLLILEVIVSHPPEAVVYEQGIPVVEFRLQNLADLDKVDASVGSGLCADRIANQNPKLECRDRRNRCINCGKVIKDHYTLCYDCASHECEYCGELTLKSGRYCSADCAAADKGMAICYCGKWHSNEYDTCFECR